MARRSALPRSRRSRLVTWVGVLAATSAAGIAATGAPAVAAPSPHPMVVAARPALPAGTTRFGALPAARTVTGAIALKPRDPQGLAAMARAITTRGSSAYHHYLPPGAFRHYFAPTDDTIAAVSSTLEAAGLTVTSVAPNGMVIDFRGSAATAESAFGTTLATYRLSSGRVAFSPSTALTLPSTIAPAVQTVVGLSTVARPRPLLVHGHGRGTPLTAGGLAHAAANPTSSSNGPVACKAASAGARQGSLTAQQIARSYGLNGLYAAGDTGAGQGVAVFELEPFSLRDAASFDKCYFGAVRAKTMLGNIHTIGVDGGVPRGPGSGEAALDVEDVQAMAPGARVDVYNAPGLLNGWIDDFNQIVSDDSDSVVTASYGLCESLMETLPGIVPAESVIFQQAAVQGQTVFASSGDTGSDECAGNGNFNPGPPFLSQSDPASQPYVTSVGGTSIVNPSTPPQERVWNDAAGFDAGGGGLSAVWDEPAWQRDSAVPGMNNPTVIAQAQRAVATLKDTGDFCDMTDPSRCREVPDVSAIADEFGGTQIIYGGGLMPTGGTSSSSPLWAGILADINASQDCQSTGGVGFASPELYSVASVPSEYKASFNDVTAGNNDEYGVAGGSFPATPGYDMATGLGSPRVAGFKNAAGHYGNGLAHFLCAAAANPGPSVTSVSPQAIASGPSSSFTITGSNFQSSGNSLVAGVTVNSTALPAADVTVTSPTTITVQGLTRDQLAGVGTGQTGDGIADVSVTAIGGATSRLAPASRIVVYTPDSHGTGIPSVAGVSRPAGPEAGGTAVHIYGSGFTDATSVTFGDTPGTDLAVVNDSELTVTTPAYQQATACLNGEDPATDICQTQVVVHTPTSASSTDTSSILPEAHGDLFDPAPGTELYQATTEFDFLPAPTLTGISLDDQLPYASELGGDLVTITGVGLSPLGLMWANIGDPTKEINEDFGIATATGDTLGLYLNPVRPTRTVFTDQLTVQTQASPNLTGDGIATTPPSNSLDVRYAATPRVKAISTSTPHHAGPDTGGTPMTIDGTGFTDPTDFVLFIDSGFSFASSATQYVVSPNAAGTQMTLKTPADSPSVNLVLVCGVSGCSDPVGHDRFTFFQPTDPIVTAMHPVEGSRGQRVVITGRNLGFVKKVLFGGVPARRFNNPYQALDQGDTRRVVAVAPPGRIGRTVSVRLATLESEVVHPDHPLTPAIPALRYTYGKVRTSTMLEVTPMPAVAGRAEKLTAAVKSAHGRAVGRVRFSVDGTVIATAALPTTGQVTVKHVFTMGTHAVTAAFLGTGDLARSHDRTRLRVGRPGRGVVGVGARLRSRAAAAPA